MTVKLRKGIIFLDNNRRRRPINKNFDLGIHYGYIGTSNLYFFTFIEFL